MPEMIAHCGLVCSNCPTYLATQADDDAARKETARYLSETYGMNFTPEQINCDGCLSEGGRLIGYCNVCEIRKCCREKGLSHCAACDDQPCEALKKFHDFSAAAKTAFEDLLKRTH